MTKNLPVCELAPLEYRVALDTASMWLARYPPLRLLCEQPALIPEVEERLPVADTSPWSSGLWLEPQFASWQVTLVEFSQQLPAGFRLAVLLSLPLARKLPERKGWSGVPLGERPGGLHRVLHDLPDLGFEIDTIQGLHCGQAVLLNTAALCARKIGRFAAADRLEFAARKQYTQLLSKAWWATCALVLATHR